MQVLRLAGGAGAVIYGVVLLTTPGGQVFGVILIANGVDNIQASVRSLAEGRHVDTLTHDTAARIAAAAGFDKEGQKLAGFVADIAVPGVAMEGPGLIKDLGKLEKATDLGKASSVVISSEGKVIQNAGAEAKTLGELLNAQNAEVKAVVVRGNAPVAKVVSTGELDSAGRGAWRLNRKNIEGYDKIRGKLEESGQTFAHAQREAITAENLAKETPVVDVYIGKEAQRYSNAASGDRTVDAIGRTRTGGHYLSEGKGADTASAVAQLEETGKRIGNVQYQEIVVPKVDTMHGYSISKDGFLLKDGQFVQPNKVKVKVRIVNE